MLKPVMRTLALAMALAPTAALAQTYAPAPSHRERAAHHHARPMNRDERMARTPRPAFGPAFGQVPPEDRNLPAISRNPDDCVKTMCTCLQGGGC